MKLIMKYRNRKLYDKDLHKYITLKDLTHYVNNNVNIQIIDELSGTDITYQVMVKVLSHKLNSTDKQVDDIEHMIRTI